MTIAQTEKSTLEKPLRLWPGVVIVLLQWLTRLGLPVIAPDIGSFAVSSMKPTASPRLLSTGARRVSVPDG